jgi:hypothetical protein
MKLSAVFLGASLVANAILLGVFFLNPVRATRAGNSSSASAATAGTRSPSSAPNPSAAAATGPAAPLANAALVSAATRLKPEDLAGVVAWLRASGFPPRAVATIVSQLVGKRFQARQEELYQSAADQPFWKNDAAAFNDPKVAAERIKLQREQIDLIKQLFGDRMMDYYSDSEEARVMLRRQVGDLPPDKLNGIATIEQDYGLMAQELRTNARGGPPSPADVEKLALLEKERRADIAKLLTPDELLDFQMHYGATSSRMRRDLALFKPSEAEYRAMFPILDTVEQQFPSNLGTTADTLAARRAAEDRLQGEMTAVLGAERYEQFKQSTDPANAQLNRLVARLDLPLAAVVDVSAVRTEIQQRATEIRQNQELGTEARNGQLAALAEEAAAKISNTLGGPRGLDAYKEYGGQWLTSLAPRPPAAPKN